MSKEAKRALVVHGSILAMAGIISKIIGFIYRVPMANMMGNTGNGLYSVSFGIYNIALTLSSYSMPLAVSKLMSSRLAKGQERSAYKVFRDAQIFALVTSSIAFLVLFFGADFFAALYRKEGLVRPLKVLAPTCFVVGMLGVCRGYYQGHRNMVPTAVSQVVEQIVNAVVSVLAVSVISKGLRTERGIAYADEAASFTAMGGTIGTLAGAIAAICMFGLLFLKTRKQRKADYDAATDTPEDNSVIFKAILLTVIPVILSQTVYQIGYTIDDMIFGNLMASKGYIEEEVTSLQGVFNTQYNQMINLPVAIATAMASATIPSVVAAYTLGETGTLKRNIDAVVKINLLIAIPAAVGLAVLAEPIMGVLFPGLGEYMDTAVMLLRTGSSAVVFYAISTITTSILQGCDHMRIPVIHSAVSLVLHIMIVDICLWYFDMSIYALIIGNVTFPLIVAVLNCVSVNKYVGYVIPFRKAFWKPLLAALVMGAAALAVYTGLKAVIHSMLIPMVVAVVVAVIVYVVMLFVTKALSAEEINAILERRKK